MIEFWYKTLRYSHLKIHQPPTSFRRYLKSTFFILFQRQTPSGASWYNKNYTVLENITELINKVIKLQLTKNSVIEYIC